MIYLNIAATRGPTACWPGYRLRNYSPELTLENVAQQELPEDAADIRRVEAAARGLAIPQYFSISVCRRGRILQYQYLGIAVL